jgi:RHS repeat-associated protein
MKQRVSQQAKLHFSGGQNVGGNPCLSVASVSSVCESIRYQYDNHLGSACLELDDTGQIISYEEYHPFGTTSYRSGRNETEVSLKCYKYIGKERDEATGLYYYGARYYAAWLCRFISVDPMAKDAPSMSPYSYCFNNPVKLVDPNGEFPWPTKGVGVIILSAQAGVGIGFGVGASYHQGIALDKYGMTHFSSYSTQYVVNQNLQDGSQNPSSIFGGGVELSVGFDYNYRYNTFAESLYSSSNSINVGRISVGGGDDSFSMSVGLGLEIGARGVQQKLIESVSLSKKESTQAGYFDSWTVSGSTLKKDDNGNSYFEGKVKSEGLFGKGQTSITVTSSAIMNKKGEYKSSGVWMSKEYRKSTGQE